MMAVRRIRRPKDKEDVFIALTDGDESVFDTYKDLMVFAACVGYSSELKRTLDKGTLDPIKYYIFSGECDRAVINMLALSETHDIKTLEGDEESYDSRFTVFEEYANAGLEIIRRKVVDAPGTILDNLIDFIHKQEDGDDEDPVNILKEIGKNL